MRRMAGPPTAHAARSRRASDHANCDLPRPRVDLSRCPAPPQPVAKSRRVEPGNHVRSMADHSSRKRLPPSSTPAFPGCLLSPSELQALRLMATGLTYAGAAKETFRSTSTIRSLLHTAYRRLGVTTIAQAFAACSHAGWLDAVPADGAVVALADRRVTWAQRLYLEAFDQFLRASDDPEEVQRTQQLREAALTGLYREAGQDLPWRRASSDPLDRLARHLQRLAPPDAA